MAKHRHGGSNKLGLREACIKANASHGSSKSRKGGKMSKDLYWRSWLIYVLAGIASGVVAYFGYKGYWEGRVYTPLSSPKVVQGSDPARFWGSYRPGVYFGLKTRSPGDILTGLMWFMPGKIQPQNLGFRHWCDQGDNLDKFGWVYHDGESFGVQEILDRGVNITTSFIKANFDQNQNGGHWSNRISAKNLGKSKSKSNSISFLYYIGVDENGKADFQPEMDEHNRLTEIRGTSPSFKNGFKLKILHGDSKSIQSQFYTCIESEGPHKFTENVMQRLRLYENKVIGLDNICDERSNLIVYQVTATVPFDLDIAFQLEDLDSNDRGDDDLSGYSYTSELEKRIELFNDRFERTFSLQRKDYNSSYINFAKAAMSNLIGGIGYFYGSSIVKSDLTTRPVKYWEAPLYSAVPSRSFFPRGFLWDEGFHNLLISKWNPDISMDILAHWMDLINVEGWIPREQILGLEAKAKVPDEFVVQHNKNANPPTLLLTLHSLLQDMDSISDDTMNFLNRMWDRLEVWYNWFNDTQRGEVPGTFRWRGRNGTTTLELNPKTLTSGLDDFPRASHPTNDERHVDLRCWMALASRLMADIAKHIGRTEAARKYSVTAEFLFDNILLDSTHWSSEFGAYLDFGLHTESVRLERQKPRPNFTPKMVRVAREEPRLQFVNQVGYISLFPFLLEILEPKSPNLGKIIDDIQDPNKLFTSYGLRSLSRTASLYMKKNTEHDPPYWRGPIWINMNYLAIRALFHYSNQEGPHQTKAREAYMKLRNAVISNVVKEYFRTGYVWEQYNDKTGLGQGCKPFTGWSTLVVLMMGEKY